MILTKIKNRLIIFVSKLLYQSRAYYYRCKNRKKKKIFIYTDSRGYEVSNLWNKKNPFSSYVGDLVKEYNVEYHICEYSSTTIIDFLYFKSSNKLVIRKPYSFHTSTTSKNRNIFIKETIKW